MAEVIANQSENALRVAAQKRWRWRRFRRPLGWVVAGGLLLIGITVVALYTAVRVVPFDPASLQPTEISTTIFDRNGKPLRGYLSTDQRWRVPARLADISPWVVKATIAVEDKRFYEHSGVDLLAIGRAFISNVKGMRIVSGASTISMQVVGFAQSRERTLGRKFTQAFRALQLERNLSKEQILELYFTQAPYGGNICGIEAAARRYFNKDASELTLSEATLLAGVPQSPTRLRPDRNAGAALKRREHVLQRMRDCAVVDARQLQYALSHKPRVGNYDALLEAPHFCDLVQRRYGGLSSIETTLDLHVQRLSEKLLKSQVGTLRSRGVSNGAVVVLENSTGNVLALCGSTDYYNAALQGQNNGAVALRSPGSTLKPLMYAFAYHSGNILPGSVLYDVPQQFPDYEPMNFDKTFHGLVASDKALAWSLNVPAVQVLNETGLSRTLQFIQNSGLRTIRRPANDYGLSLAIGTCSVNLLELTNAYAMLAREGVHKPYRLLKDDSASLHHEERLLSAGASYFVNRALADADLRPPESLDPSLAGLTEVAWKTGTSSAYKDAWTIAYDKHHTVGVWLGNFNGRSSRALVGVEAAAPVALNLVKALKPATAGARNTRWPAPPLHEIGTQVVCTASGARAGHDCPTTRTAECLARRNVKSEEILVAAPLCSIHRKVRVDAVQRQQLCMRCWQDRPSVEEVFAFWPTPVAAWISDNQGLALQPPPHFHECSSLAGRPDLRITSPRPGDEFFVSADRSASAQKVALEASAPPQSSRIFWFLDGELLQTTDRSAVAYLTPKPGTHTLRCVDDHGRADWITFTVQEH